jgi:hypothetical protein
MMTTETVERPEWVEQAERLNARGWRLIDICEAMQQDIEDVRYWLVTVPLIERRPETGTEASR